MKLWGLVLGACALVWPGCSKQDSSPALAAGPAGVVVELSGSVEASRAGAEPRPLAVDAEVFADDTIETGADSSVSIRLEHNNAALRLESEMSRRVDETLAWKAPRREDDSVLDGEVDDRTAAAGRHTEREAAGSASTAVANEPDETRAAETAPEPTHSVSEKQEADARARAKKRAERARAKQRQQEREARARKKALARERRRRERETRRKKKARFESAPAPAPAPTGSSKPGKTRGGPIDVKKLVRARIKVCHALADDAGAGEVTAVVKVAAGKLAIVSVEGSTDALAGVAGCARKKIARLSVTGAKPGTYRVTLRLE